MAGKFLNSAIPIRVTAILIRSTSEAQMLFSQSLREAIRQSVSWVLCCPLQETLSMDVGFIPEGPQKKQPRLMHDMRQRMATRDEQAMEFLLQSDQSGADFWQSTGAKLAKRIGAQVLRLVERRLIYAASMSVEEEVSLYSDGDEVHGARKDSEDVYLVSMNMSADMTSILYPIQTYTGKSLFFVALCSGFGRFGVVFLVGVYRCFFSVVAWVFFCGGVWALSQYLGSYKVTPKRNYFGAYGQGKRAIRHRKF